MNQDALQLWDLGTGRLEQVIPVECDEQTGEYLYCAQFCDGNMVLAGGSGTNDVQAVNSLTFEVSLTLKVLFSDFYFYWYITTTSHVFYSNINSDGQLSYKAKGPQMRGKRMTFKYNFTCGDKPRKDITTSNLETLTLTHQFRWRNCGLIWEENPPFYVLPRSYLKTPFF